MKRNGPMRIAWPLTLIALAMVLLAPPAEAQLWRTLGVTESDGEPTDPDGMFEALNAAGVVLDDNGISSTAPTDEAEVVSWWEAILDLLRELGFLEEDADR